ncbi:hypothetical protein [Dapis sp. BLCC M172]|uniref:hypothetical protein n=1 Tax=Dapis sp. BLCC M172 TaxID=2975281 RepID=UPI003CF37A37
MVEGVWGVWGVREVREVREREKKLKNIYLHHYNAGLPKNCSSRYSNSQEA